MASSVIASTTIHPGVQRRFASTKPRASRLSIGAKVVARVMSCPPRAVGDVRLPQVDRQMQPLVQDEQAARHRVGDDDRRQKLLGLGTRRPAGDAPDQQVAQHEVEDARRQIGGRRRGRPRLANAPRVCTPMRTAMPISGSSSGRMRPTPNRPTGVSSESRPARDGHGPHEREPDHHQRDRIESPGLPEGSSCSRRTPSPS